MISIFYFCKIFINFHFIFCRCIVFMMLFLNEFLIVAKHLTTHTQNQPGNSTRQFKPDTSETTLIQEKVSIGTYSQLPNRLQTPAEEK